MLIDKLKLAVAVLIMAAGVYGYYQLPAVMGPDVSILLRVGLILAAIVASLGVAASSEYGASLIEFSKGSRIELRKMVWPTRPETIQTTAIVLVLVVIVALFLWAVDALVFNIIYDYFLGIDD